MEPIVFNVPANGMPDPTIEQQVHHCVTAALVNLLILNDLRQLTSAVRLVRHAGKGSNPYMTH